MPISKNCLYSATHMVGIVVVVTAFMTIFREVAWGSNLMASHVLNAVIGSTIGVIVLKTAGPRLVKKWPRFFGWLA